MLRKFLLAPALVLVASLNASGQGTPAEKVGYTYCLRGEQYLYLYDSLSTFNVLAKLKCGERLDILGSENGYVMVRTADGKQGYVPLDGITSTPPAKARAAQESTTSRLPQPAPPAAPTPPAKAPETRESTTSRLPQPTTPVAPTPPAKAPETRESTTSRLPQPAPPVAPTPPAKAPEAPESTTSRLPQPAPAETPTPPAKAPEARESTTSRLPQPAPAETPMPPAKAPEAPIIRAPQRVPAETLTPLAEIFGGYSYLNFDTNGLSSRQSFNGWESSVAVNANRWLAAEGSISGYYKSYSFDLTALGLGRLKSNVHDHSFMAGPRINFQPAFFHVLLGIEHLTATAVGYSASENSFAAAFGGGAQWKIARQWAVRASADYFITRHNLLNAQSPVTQNNIRISGGVVYTFRPRSE